ncbi:MAG: GAF domain-containing protein [Anaerolineae bacterium]|nr:GAF domain-containing protein [Anaerolineae bacterium]
MFRRLRWPFQVRHKYANPLEQRQARGLTAMALVLFLLLLVGLFQTPLLPSAPNILFLANIPVLITSSFFVALQLVVAASVLVVAIMTSRGNLHSARVLYVMMLFALGFGLYIFRGLDSLFALGLAVPVVSAAVLLTRRGLLVTVMLTLLAVIVVFLFSALGLLAFQRIQPLALATQISFATLSLSLIGITLILFLSEQRALAQRNEALAAEVSTMAATSHAIGEAQSVEDLLARTVEMIRMQLGYYHVQAFLVQEKTGVISLATGNTEARGGGELPRRRIAPDGATAVNEAVRTGQMQHVTLTSPEEHRSEFLPATRSELLVPLRRGPQVIGVLDVQSVQENVFGDEDIQTLTAIVTQAAMAIDNLRLTEAQQELNRERHTLLEQVRSTSYEIERLNQEIRGRSWVHYLESRPDKLIGFDWVSGTIVPTATPVPGLVGAANPRIETRDGTQVLVVPIHSRGQVLGVMEFQAPRDRVWDQRSLELARAIAQRLALSLDNLRLFEQAQMTVAREQVANQIATMLQARSDMDSLIEVATDAFQQALGATRTSIRLGMPAPTDAASPNRNGGADS